MDGVECQEYRECRANRPCENYCRLWYLTLGQIHCRDFEIARQKKEQLINNNQQDGSD